MGNGAGSFEEALKELEQLVGMLEKGDLPLDESIEVWKKGVELSRSLGRRLDEVERKIVLLVEGADGEIMEEDFNPESGGGYGG